MTDLYDQRIDAMKAREHAEGLNLMTLAMCWDTRSETQDQRNAERLAAYKRKRAEYV